MRVIVYRSGDEGSAGVGRLSTVLYRGSGRSRGVRRRGNAGRVLHPGGHTQHHRGQKSGAHRVSTAGKYNTIRPTQRAKVWSTPCLYYRSVRHNPPDTEGKSLLALLQVSATQSARHRGQKSVVSTTGQYDTMCPTQRAKVWSTLYLYCR
jgi:hypothetical protein